ncbi:MAG: alpha/beta hydrolase [Solirubrobacteraceae bacterium]|nr:alpha/beta hydrolase [Solirubrobacteraceae bacterium]
MERFTTSDGVAIAYDYDDSAPDGLPPVVLLHGFGVDSQINWGTPGIVDGLADADRKTVILDARGHGESGKPADAPREPAAGEPADAPNEPAAGIYGEPRMALDVRELVDELGVESYDLVGYSMGAITALLIAAADPRVRRLVVGGVGAGVIEVGGLDTRELPPELIVPALLADDPTAAGLHPLGVAWRSFLDTAGADRVALAAQLQAAHKGGVDLNAITVPTMVLVGDSDNLARNPELLADALPDGRVYRLPAADHLGAPSHPRFLTAISDFLAG